MGVNDFYEDITSDEADFILDIYAVIDALFYNGYRAEQITLVGLAHQLGVKTDDLANHLPIILTILKKVEEEYTLRQKPD